MNSLKKTFKTLKKQKRRALIPYFMAFYPDRMTFRKLLLSAQEAGADLIEVGIPFSDPIADGPTIQEAGQVALSNGATLEKVLSLLTGMRKEVSVPLVVMSYANLLLRHGLDRFFKQAFSAGIRGAVIPDLILEESAHFKEAANRHGIELILFVAPTTPGERLKDIAEAAQGFIYLVSVTGVTGARPGRTFSLRRYVSAVRKVTDTPVCVGFGIATPQQAASVAKVADGVIIGSALIEIMKQQDKDVANAVGRFLKSVRKAIDTPGGLSCG
jgi:tryptophan synthase alpha chain